MTTLVRDDDGQECPPMVIAARNGHDKAISKLITNFGPGSKAASGQNDFPSQEGDDEGGIVPLLSGTMGAVRRRGGGIRLPLPPHGGRLAVASMLLLSLFNIHSGDAAKSAEKLVSTP